MEENVDNKDVKNIFEWIDDAVKDSFEFRNPLDCLKGSKHP